MGAIQGKEGWMQVLAGLAHIAQQYDPILE